MRIIPVLDVMNGQVVRAVGGRREEYKPVNSLLTRSTDPVEVAQAMIQHTRADALYVADLDGIMRNEPNPDLVDDLSDFFQLEIWTDIGIRRIDPRLSPKTPQAVMVLGSETIQDPDVVAEAQKRLTSKIAFSLDMRGDRILGNVGATPSRSGPGEVLHILRQLNWVQNKISLIILDLNSIGLKAGPGKAAEYCNRIRDAFGADGEIYIGGGIRNWDDVLSLESAGATGVLVASAIHNGTLTFSRRGS